MLNPFIDRHTFSASSSEILHDFKKYPLDVVCFTGESIAIDIQDLARKIRTEAATEADFATPVVCASANVGVSSGGYSFSTRHICSKLSDTTGLVIGDRQVSFTHETRATEPTHPLAHTNTT
ncbi:MAG: hypothetical protein M3Y56_01455 [Armatimonadota bacterium]|nr:hypothetical protein [Armatimonadota bacterium]